MRIDHRFFSKVDKMVFRIPLAAREINAGVYVKNIFEMYDVHVLLLVHLYVERADM